MKSDKKILVLIFIVSIIGLFTESLGCSEIKREDIIFKTVEWLNYVSPNLHLLFLDLEKSGEYNSPNALLLNYFNVGFYVFFLLGGVLYWFSNGKETRLIRFLFAVLLLNKLLLFLLIIPSNVIYYEQVKGIPYLWPRALFFMINHTVWCYLAYKVLQSLTKDRTLEQSDDKSKLAISLKFVDTPQIQRFMHVVIDSFFCLLTCSFATYNFFKGNVLNAIQSVLGERVTLYIVFFISAFIYYIFFEVVLGSTPAKFLTESRVIRLKGEKISFQQGFLRTLYRRVPFASLSFLFSTNGAHDYWTDTRVVKEARIGAKGHTYLWGVFIAAMIGLTSFAGHKLYEYSIEENIDLKSHEVTLIDLENQLAHLDTTVVFQLSHVDNRYTDSTIFLKVESVRGDSIELSLFKYKEDRTTFEIEREYAFYETPLPKIRVHKSIFKNNYKPDYDRYTEELPLGESFLNDGEKYIIKKIRRFYGPSIEYLSGSSTYTEEYGVMIQLFNIGSSATITTIENLQGDLKWENDLPLFVNAMDISGNVRLKATNFKLKEKYKSILIVEGANGVKQKYIIEIQNSVTYLYRIFE